MEEYKRLHTIGKVFGIESFVLSQEETKQLYPLMNVSDIYGTLYSPRQESHANCCTSLLTRSSAITSGRRSFFNFQLMKPFTFS